MFDGPREQFRITGKSVREKGEAINMIIGCEGFSSEVKC